MKRMVYPFLIGFMVYSLLGCSRELTPTLVPVESIEVLEPQVEAVQDTSELLLIESKLLTNHKSSDRSNVSMITYKSDGLKINGYYSEPIDASEKLPVIIFNRGGNKDFGKIERIDAVSLFPYFNDRGYVVLASQYRGGGGSEGEDEFGGADVNDISSLIELVEEFEHADASRIYMMGASRGGMMTYLSIRKHPEIKAAASIAGVSDLARNFEEREEPFQKVVLELIKASPDEAADEYDERSAIKWFEEISVPLLLLHGSEDWRVLPYHSEALYQAMYDGGKDVKLIIYEGDDHSLSQHLKESFDEILLWFDEHP